MLIFPEENNTGLPPVLFRQHSLLHILKVTDISVKLNRMQCKQSDFAKWKKKFFDFKLFVVWRNERRLSIWTQLCSITTFKHWRH